MLNNLVRMLFASPYLLGLFVKLHAGFYMVQIRSLLVFFCYLYESLSGMLSVLVLLQKRFF